MKEKFIFQDDEILKTELFNIGQDWELPIPSFFILAPNRKIKSIAEFTSEESTEFMDLLIKLRKGMRDVLNIDDVYLFQNEDTEHGLHLWVFPRLDWMEQFGRKIQSVRPIMNYAKENMMQEVVIKEVKESVAKMKEYFEKTN